MSGGQRIDWRAIPTRFRRWQALPTWRKLLWLVTRAVTMVVAYAFFAVGILWYNEPDLVGAIVAGDRSPFAIFGAFAATPELLVIMLILVPAVVAAVLLPHRPDWQR